ncbi:hypothetical protein JTB14_012683 [Gonioctena quinquepunctata]|nr:hypothetical protein JTB14_012683 [Gonioctena quinquepunctata]
MLRAIMGADLGVELDMPPTLKEWSFNTASAGTASWSGGRGHRLEMALRISPLPVRRVATRGIPSEPGYNWVTLPSFHCKGLRKEKKGKIPGIQHEPVQSTSEVAFEALYMDGGDTQVSGLWNWNTYRNGRRNSTLDCLPLNLCL